MRAHVLRRYGRGRDIIDWVDIEPEPLGSDDVRIAVAAAGINPVDVKTCEGEPKLILPRKPPFVLGVELAGRVMETGRDVTALRVGDEVFAYGGMDRMGAFAESVVLPASRVAQRPGSMRAEEAACLPLAGLCALAALDAAGTTGGSRVLVHGGAGGVGSVAVQLASQLGAEVYATASKGDLDRVLALGASRAIDRHAERFEDVAKEVDLVIDTVGGEVLGRSWRAVRRGGVVASLHVPPPAERLVEAGLRAPWILRALLPIVTRGARAAAKRAGARLVPILTLPSAEGLRRLSDAATQLGLQVGVGDVVAFDALGEALDRLVRPERKGRIVLRGA